MSTDQRDPFKNPGLRLEVVESDAVEPTQLGSGLETQDQQNVEEGSIQAASEVVLQSTEAGLGLEFGSFQVVGSETIQANSGVAVQLTRASLGLESHSFQEQPNVKEGSTQGSSGVVVQPRQVGWGRESHSFQEQPNVEEGIIRVNSGVAVQPAPAGLGLESDNFQEQPPDVEDEAIQANGAVAQAGLELESHSLQEQANVEEDAIQASSGVAVQPTQVGSGLESDSFQEQPNVEEVIIQVNSGVAVQPAPAGLGPESESFQEQPDVEDEAILAQPTQAALPNLSDLVAPLSVEEHALFEWLLQNLHSASDMEQPDVEDEAILAQLSDLVAPPSVEEHALFEWLLQILHSAQDMEQPDVEDESILAQLIQAALPNRSDLVAPLSVEYAIFEWLLQNLHSASDMEQPDVEDGAILAQLFDLVALLSVEVHAFLEWLLQNLHSASDMEGAGWIVDPIDGGVDNSIRAQTDSQQTQNREEDNGIHDRNALQAFPSDLEDVGWIELADLELPIDREEDNGIQPQIDIQQMQNCEEDDGIQPQVDIQQMQNREEDDDIDDRSASQALLSDQRHEQADLELPIDGEKDNGIQAQIENQQIQNPEEDEGIHDRNAPQAFPSDLDAWIELADLEDPIDDEIDNDIQVQTDSHGEDNGIRAQTGSQQMQDVPPEQGTAGRRMRLQVPLGGAKGLSESNCASIASCEGTCVCGVMSSEQKAGCTCSLSHAFTSNQPIFNLEGDPKGPISCVSESGYPDVTQQIPQDVSGSSSTPRSLSLTSLVNLLGDACIFTAELPVEIEEINFSSEDSFSGRGYSETVLERRQSMASHLRNTGPYLQQRKMPSSSGKDAEIIKTQLEPAQALSDEECRKPCMALGTGLSECLFWPSPFLCMGLRTCLFWPLPLFFHTICGLRRMAFTSLQ